MHFDSGFGESERLIVIATAENLKLLQGCPEWYLDGTFKVYPASFKQMYSVHVIPAPGQTVGFKMAPRRRI